MQDGRVSQTALGVAAAMVTLGQSPRWRRRLPAGLASLSEELLLAAGDPLYTRSTLRLAKRPWAVRLSESGGFMQPATFQDLARRKLFVDEQVRFALADGVQQVLVVGAGFDTLCLRLAPHNPEVQFLEIDHPATAAAKQRGVENVGQPPNLSLLQADLAVTALDDVLADDAGWLPQGRSVVVCEGLLYYLTRADVRNLFERLHGATGPASRVVFSHLTGLRRHGLARAGLRLFGEPWLSASTVEQLPAYLGPGWRTLVTSAGRLFDLEGFAVVERMDLAEAA